MENDKEIEKEKTEQDGGDPKCPVGYIWDASLKECVLDVGAKDEDGD